jgi:hypothetical protein
MWQETDPFPQVESNEVVRGSTHAAELAAQAWAASGQRLLRIDGFMATGKSTIARKVADRTDAHLIETDDFLLPESNERQYVTRLDVVELRRAVSDALVSKPKVIVEGVCLGRTLPEADYPGFKLYVKRVSVLGIDLFNWHDIYDLWRQEAEDPLHESIIQYHREFQPYLGADLQLAMPEWPEEPQASA